MSKVQKAHGISVFNCEHCSSVHIGLWRNGKMIAEAIPASVETAELFRNDLDAAITEQKRRESLPHVH